MNKVLNTAIFAVSVTILAGAWLLMPAFHLRAQGSAASTFDAKCAACHSKDGSGSSPMGKSMKIPDLRSKAVQSKSNAELDSVISKGQGMMPAYGSQLSKEEISGLVAYIRHLGGKKK